MELEGRNIVVADAAGAAGRGAVRQLLVRGANVVAVSHSAARLAELREELCASERLTTLVGELSSEAAAAEAGRRVAEIAPALDGVVASFGRSWQGACVIDLALGQWTRLISGGLDAHFLAAKTFLPRLRERAGASYTLLSDAAARTPSPGAGPVNVAAAGQVMLARVLDAEWRHSPVRVNAIVLTAPVRARRHESAPEAWLCPDDVGRYVAWLVSPQARGVRGRTLVFPPRSRFPRRSSESPS